MNGAFTHAVDTYWHPVPLCLLQSVSVVVVVVMSTGGVLRDTQFGDDGEVPWR